MPDPEGVGFLSQLHRNLSSGLEVLDKIPTYFETVIDKNLWQRQEFPNGIVVKSDSFRSFIESPPPRGFGISIEKLKEICRHHPEVLARIEVLTREDSISPEEQINRRRLKRRLERLLKDFPRDQVLTGMRNMGLITASAPATETPRICATDPGRVSGPGVIDKE